MTKQFMKLIKNKKIFSTTVFVSAVSAFGMINNIAFAQTTKKFMTEEILKR